MTTEPNTLKPCPFIKPLSIGMHDRGLGRIDYGVLCGDRLIASALTERQANYLVDAVNEKQRNTPDPALQEVMRKVHEFTNHKAYCIYWMRTTGDSCDCGLKQALALLEPYLGEQK